MIFVAFVTASKYFCWYKGKLLLVPFNYFNSALIVWKIYIGFYYTTIICNSDESLLMQGRGIWWYSGPELWILCAFWEALQKDKHYYYYVFHKLLTIVLRIQEKDKNLSSLAVSTLKVVKSERYANIGLIIFMIF